jgi:hypothetical protein
MQTVLRYRGRVIGAAQVEFIRETIAAHPAANRRALSIRLCEAWDWRQPNGQLCDALCRGLLLALHRAGHIELPAARRRRTPHPGAMPRKAEPVLTDCPRLRCSLEALGPIEIQQVRRSPEERVCNGLIAAYHPLGYSQPVGEHLKYLVYARQTVVAALAWSSAPRHLGPRDRFIGWSAETRRQNLHLVAYNTRFLILPWVEVPHLASHLLGRMAKQVAQDWEKIYRHPVYFLETFVDPERHRGTCYRAANWIRLGQTTGRGKNAPSSKPTRSKKEILGYPLTRRFRERMGVVQ